MSPDYAVKNVKTAVNELESNLQWILKTEDLGEREELLEGATGQTIRTLKHTINKLRDESETVRVRDAIQQALSTVQRISGSMSDYEITVSIRAAHGHLWEVDQDKPDVSRI